MFFKSNSSESIVCKFLQMYSKIEKMDNFSRLELLLCSLTNFDDFLSTTGLK